MEHGFRVAILNHLGAPENVRLTAPRIFTYGKCKITNHINLKKNNNIFYTLDMFARGVFYQLKNHSARYFTCQLIV